MPESTVLVTGASGRVGRAVVLRLRARGLRVRALVHRRDAPGADEAVRGSLLDPASLAGATAGADAVVHAAAVTHARREAEYARVNVEGTAALLAAAADAGVHRFVHVSTRAIDPAGGAYSRTKAEAERLVVAAPLDAVVVRLPEIYGAGGSEGIDELIARARAGRPLLVVGRGRDELRPVPLADAADAVAAALDAPAGRVYTLGGEALTMREVAEACAAACGGRSRVVGVPRPLVELAAFAARWLPLPLVPDQPARLRAPKPAPSPEAADELGFAPPPFREGLARAVRSS